MGFIPSGSTITVEAKLTAAGKKKIYDSIEVNSSGFATKFALGDSDSNYNSIDSGNGTLESGHVPEASDFKPAIRSFVLSKGTYRPGVPVLLVEDDYGPDINMEMSIGRNGTFNEQVNKLFKILTEWPKNTAFSEVYKLTPQVPTNMTEETFKRLFVIPTQGILSRGYAIGFTGNATDDELDMLLGSDRNGSTTIAITARGLTTNQTATIYVEVKK